LALCFVGGGVLSAGCDRDTLIGIDVPPFGTGGTYGPGSGGTFGPGSGGTIGGGSGGTIGGGSGGSPGSTACAGGTGGATGAVSAGPCSVIGTFPGILNGCGRTTTVAFSPDGTLLATSTQDASQPNLHVWRVCDGTLLYEVAQANNQAGSYGVTFSPNGKLLALGGVAPVVDGAGTDAAAVFDAATGRLITSLPTKSGTYASAVTFSHDGTRLVTAGFSSFIDVWRVADWSEALAIPNDGSVYDVDFAPDDSTFVVSGGSINRILRSSDGAQLVEMTGLFAEQDRATYSPNGQLILSTAGAGQLQILDAHANTLQVMTFTSSTAFDPIGHAAWIDDSHFVADDWNGAVQEWEKDPAQPQGPFSLKQSWQMPSQALGIAVAPDRLTFVVAGDFGFQFLTP